MNLDHLAIFVDLAETLNFRKTAYRKSISQPAVSQAINSVENEIGVKLFKRSRSGVAILPTGQLLYENIKPLLNTYYKTIQIVREKNNQRSTLTIGITDSPFESFFIPRSLPKFQRQHPNIKLFIQNFDHTQLKRQLINGDCDLILTTQDDVEKNKNINYLELINGNFCAVVPKNNYLSGKKQFSLNDFQGQNLILLDNNWCPPEQLKLQELIRKKKIVKDIAYVNNVNTANIMCEAELGITLCPDFICGKENQFIKPITIDYPVRLSYGIATLKGNSNRDISLFAQYFKTQF